MVMLLIMRGWNECRPGQAKHVLFHHVRRSGDDGQLTIAVRTNPKKLLLIRKFDTICISYRV
jgi:hypothetical protein